MLSFEALMMLTRRCWHGRPEEATPPHSSSPENLPFLVSALRSMTDCAGEVTESSGGGSTMAARQWGSRWSEMPAAAERTIGMATATMRSTARSARSRATKASRLHFVNGAHPLGATTADRFCRGG